MIESLLVAGYDLLLLLFASMAFMPLGIIPCPSCCPVVCTIFADVFSVDNLATDWDDRAGTWAVAGGRLVTTSASALIVTVAETSGTAAGVYVSANVICATTADIGRVIAGYIDDSNHWFAEVQPGASSGTMKLYERSGGVNTQRGTTQTIAIVAGDTIQVIVCIGGGYVTATAWKSTFFGSTAVHTFHEASPTVTNTQAGVGTGAGSSDVQFDVFTLNRHRFDDLACPGCVGLCIACDNSNDEAPLLVQHVVTGIADSSPFCFDCDELNATFIMPYVTTSPCAWQITFDSPLTTCLYTGASSSYGGGILNLVLSYGSSQIIFSSGGISSNCTGWNGIVLPTTGSGGTNCTRTGAQDVVTAL